MTFLRFRYTLDFESLCAETSDSIAWRRLSRLPFDTAVPHPTTRPDLALKGPAGQDLDTTAATDTMTINQPSADPRCGLNPTWNIAQSQKRLNPAEHEANHYPQLSSTPAATTQ